MIELLIYNPTTALMTDTSFGGLPVKPTNTEFDWPICSQCHGHMCYLGKIKTELGLELIFMCENDPGMCGDEDPDGGANQVIIISELDDLKQFTPKNPENTLRKTEYNAILKEDNADSYESARANWQGRGREILGQLFGQPDWIQGDDTPKCDCCQKPMRFVAQIEEGPEYLASMNFGGGGVAFLFDCPKGKTAKFLWQC